MAKEHLIYIITLNWNGWIDTIECLESIFRQGYTNYKVILCDNNSQDDSWQNIKAWADGRLDVLLSNDSPLHHLSFPSVLKPIPYVEYNRTEAETGINCTHEDIPLVLIQTGSNLGFTGGNNVGIGFALANNADYIWLLNYDTVISSDSLTEMVNVSEADQNIGVVGSKIYFANPTNLIWFAGAKFYRHFCQSVMIGFGKLDDGQSWEKNVDAAFITGCSMLVKSEVFRKIGCLDDDYFFGMEDLDFGIRVNANDFKCIMSARSKIWHKVSTSTGGMDSPIYTYYYLRNRLLLMKKHGYWIEWPIFILHFTGSYIIKYVVVSIIRRRSFACYTAVYCAIKDFIQGRTGKISKESEKLIQRIV
jgi:GT2 family glycosyltransferase